MKVYTISFYRTSDAQHMSVQFRAQQLTKQAVENALKKNRKDINTWLLFGETDMIVSNVSTGEVVAKGRYEYNVFASSGKYEFQILEMR
jgi:hypothetical protein